jgi:hypothetical protein
MPEAHFTCPCCGYQTFSEPPGSFDVCPVCFWEDDGLQLLNPAYRGGANGPSLMECQTNYLRLGACEERFLNAVRPPEANELRDPEWRPATESDLRRARTPGELSAEEYRRAETWYYWKRKDI